MTSPLGPKDFPLSRDWWLSGSAWPTKTADDVWKVLRVKERPVRQRQQAVRLYYAKHEDRLRFVPDELRNELGLGRLRLALFAPDATDEQIDALVDFLKSDD